jgi:hypothetical protein
LYGEPHYRYFLYSLGSWDRGSTPPNYVFFIRGLDALSDYTQYSTNYKTYVSKVDDSEVEFTAPIDITDHATVFTDLPSDVYTITIDGFEKPTDNEILLPGNTLDTTTLNFNYSSTVDSAATITL